MKLRIISCVYGVKIRLNMRTVLTISKMAERRKMSFSELINYAVQMLYEVARLEQIKENEKNDTL